MSLGAALRSLQGLSVGDAFGQQFFTPGAARRIENRELPAGPWRWTDDTHMALSVMEVLRDHGRINQQALAVAFSRRFQSDPHRGYGGGAQHLLHRISRGDDWRRAARELFNGGSYGNGGAMRVAPLGGFYAEDVEQAATDARLSAEITHAHPEGQAGAIAVAVAAALAVRKDRPVGLDFLNAIIRFVPGGLTRQGIEQAMHIPPHALSEAAGRLGSGRQVSAQDTVPFCLWCAAYSLEDYSAALWRTVSGLGDRDTTCAIVGGIVALSAPHIPLDWVRRREPLPPGFELET